MLWSRAPFGAPIPCLNVADGLWHTSELWWRPDLLWVSPITVKCYTSVLMIWCAYSRGWGVQWNDYGGRCGICGDAWGDFPREHEAPLGQLSWWFFLLISKSGKFATGTLVRHYTSGSWVPVIVDITTNHGGYFAFKVTIYIYNLNVKYHERFDILDIVGSFSIFDHQHCYWKVPFLGTL